MEMKMVLVVGFLVLQPLSLAEASEQKLLEIPRTQVIPIQDTKSGRPYELYVKLPEGYSENSDIEYPVVYFTDGMWGFEILSASTEYLMENVILVGISWQKDLKIDGRAHASRFRDYSIKKSTKPEHQEKYQFGQASHHLNFIRNDVIRYVENNYRTVPENRTYFGYSLGGLFGAYILLTAPETFKNYILGSPSLRGSLPNLSELEANEALKRKGLNANVFISNGALEKELGEHAEEFITLLKKRNDGSISLQHVVIEGNHQTAFPMTGVRSVAWLSKLTRDEEAIDTELSFKDIPLLKEAIIHPTPIDRKDAISVGELGMDGGNKNMIVKLAREIAENKHDRFDSLLIAHKDKLLFESYYMRGRINMPHPQASTTKAYTGLAIGRAIQLGYLTMADLHKPLVSFLKDLDSTRFVEGAEMITLHKAMTMHSGIRIGKEKMKEVRENPSQLKGQDQVQVYLEHSAPISSHSQTFHYQSTDPSMVMQVLDAVVPGSAKDFIKNELLDKMGIHVYRWEDDISGLPTGAYGSSMTSRDMIKWGALAINKGKWRGEQLISEAFIAKATSKITQPSAAEIVTTEEITGTSYGYYWWLDEIKVGNETYLSKSAQGGGGQYIIVVEELDLLVVVTAHNKTFHHETLSLLANRILPAFIQ